MIWLVWIYRSVESGAKNAAFKWTAVSGTQPFVRHVSLPHHSTVFLARFSFAVVNFQF